MQTTKPIQLVIQPHLETLSAAAVSIISASGTDVPVSSSSVLRRLRSAGLLVDGTSAPVLLFFLCTTLLSSSTIICNKHSEALFVDLVCFYSMLCSILCYATCLLSNFLHIKDLHCACHRMNASCQNMVLLAVATGFVTVAHLLTQRLRLGVAPLYK